jgi:flagellar basal-body rod modification protein FlgD
MNALVSFRSNAVGNLSARPEQRDAARMQIQSNFAARLQGILKAVQGASVADTSKAAETEAPAAAKATEETTGTDTTVPKKDLDRDAFLRLLIQQMTNQDPLEPTSNEEMVAQLAQFSALEQMEKLNKSFETMSGSFDFLNGNIDQLNFISAQGLLGKFVEGVSVDGEIISGEVESVHLAGSVVMLTVNGKPMPMSGVVGIANQRPAEAETEGS